MNSNVSELGISIKSYPGKQGFSEIKSDWEFVEKSMKERKFFHLYSWYKSYMDAFESDGHSVYFFIAYQKYEPIAIFPLKKSIRKILGLSFNIFEIPDHSHIPLSDFVYARTDEKGAILNAFLIYMQTTRDVQWDYICLPHVPENSGVIFSLQWARCIFSTTELIGRSDFLEANSFQEIRNTFSKNFRSNLKKARNKLLLQKNVEFLTFITRQDLVRNFGEFLDVEASGWKGEKGEKTAIKLHPDITKFYKELIQNVPERDGCIINLLKVNGICVAGQFYLAVDKTLYVLKIGYNEEFAKMAPGNLLLEYAIQKAFEGKMNTCINLVSDARWHRDWKPHSVGILRVYLCRKAFWGTIAFILIKLKQKLRLFYRKGVLKDLE